MIPIRSEFRDFVEPRWIRRTVIRLLSSLPESHLRGLSVIVLTETSIAGEVRVTGICVRWRRCFESWLAPRVPRRTGVGPEALASGLRAGKARDGG